MPGSGADLLPPHLLRSLGQKEYDKRKGAALEIEQAIKDLRDAGQHERVREVVLYVVRDLAGSPHPNVRKGALHALAGVAIGLREDLPQFLPEILPPVLASFCDPDCRVRYYACESLYNIAKVARSHCVAHFNDIFEALFKLSADTDLGVQNGFQLLDRLMKDIVAESDNFDISAFMPLLRRRIFVANS
ncbi:vacuolar 14 Fab1-binding region-domain-containing protein [Pavlovales sp. CCMP2436]|nr:vacuolar 14 Fab1-binding region-domain-containing protein [Pavlovales sp. CCMP2436]